MKTIEERINQIVEEHAECRWLDASELKQLLEQIATEQKAIDDAEKKLWLDKACEWWNKLTFEGSKYGIEFPVTKGWIAEFRKTMEK